MILLYVEDILKNNQIIIKEKSEILPSAINKERMLVQNVNIDDHQLRFILDVETQQVNNVVIDEDVDLNIPQTLLKDLAKTVRAAIKKATEEEAAAKAQLEEAATQTGSTPVNPNYPPPVNGLEETGNYNSEDVGVGGNLDFYDTETENEPENSSEEFFFFSK